MAWTHINAIPYDSSPKSLNIRLHYDKMQDTGLEEDAVIFIEKQSLKNPNNIPTNQDKARLWSTYTARPE